MLPVRCRAWKEGSGSWRLTAGCTADGDTRLLAFRAMESLLEGQGLLRWNPPDQVRQKLLCQQAGPAGEESFKLGKIRERDVTTHRQVRMRWNGLANKGYRVMQTRRALEKNVSGLKAEVGSVNYQSNTQFCLMS